MNEIAEAKRRQQFDTGYAVYARPAMAAASAQQKIAEQRHIVVPKYPPIAGRTTGTGMDHGEIARPAVDADVQEAADEEPEEGRQRGIIGPPAVPRTPRGSGRSFDSPKNDGSRFASRPAPCLVPCA